MNILLLVKEMNCLIGNKPKPTCVSMVLVTSMNFAPYRTSPLDHHAAKLRPQKYLILAIKKNTVFNACMC